MSTNQKTFSWQAPEFKYYEKNIGWYVTLLTVCLLIVVFFIFEKDYFAAITIAILGGFVVFFSAQRPEQVSVVLTAKALQYGNVTFPYKQLKHFWIVNNERHRTLIFQTNTLINHTIILELLDQNEDEIREFLLKYLPEHHASHETFVQRISHRFKF